jgi:hypothetical protein
MMQLDELIRQLSAIREQLGRGDSPVILEGNDDDDHLVQACVDGTFTESRCEDEDEPQGVFLRLSELTIG